MNNYLFFRTDRIGDFLLSAILLNSIKRNDPNSHISVVCSSKNYNYVKKFHLVDKAILYPEKNLFKKTSFFLKMFLKKNYCTIICDGKKRSIYSAILIKSKVKILFTTKNLHKILFKFFFSKILVDKYAKSKILEIQNALHHLKFNFIEKDLNTLKVENDKNFSIIAKKDFILLHFDEKWIHKSYIKSYKKIEPSINEFKKFMEDVVAITKKNLVITTGLENNYLIDEIKSELDLVNNNIFKKHFNSNSIFLFNDTNFFDIEFLISKSNLLIASHGAVTHVAASLNIRIFDIIDNSENIFFDKWTSHFRRYKKFVRKDFNLLSKEIINNL